MEMTDNHVDADEEETRCLAAHAGRLYFGGVVGNSVINAGGLMVDIDAGGDVTIDTGVVDGVIVGGESSRGGDGDGRAEVAPPRGETKIERSQVRVMVDDDDIGNDDVDGSTGDGSATDNGGVGGDGQGRPNTTLEPAIVAEEVAAVVAAEVAVVVDSVVAAAVVVVVVVVMSEDRIVTIARA